MAGASPLLASLPKVAAGAENPPLDARPAIVHDWFQGYHGSERTVEAMRSELFAPGAAPDVLTFHAAHELLPPELSAAIVRESRLAALPGLRQRGHDPGHWRDLLPLMPRYFRSLDLSPYDLVISSSHACAAMVLPPPGALHVVYCHTPMRYAWSPDTDRRRLAGPRRAALGLLARRLRRLDREAARRPDFYVANSEAVRSRIARFYGRDAVVVHPPVDVDELAPGREKDSDLFLWVHRLVPYKNPLLVAEAFRGLPQQLVMVGVGPLEDELRRRLPANVTLRGWLPREELRELFERSAGFVHAAEEDFGISMVEALAAGTPVVGLARGGALDIVRDGRDGILVGDATADEIRRAVAGVADRDWDRGALAARAAEFSRGRFVDRMRGLIAEARRGDPQPTAPPRV
jgi:glycosyltransferase involved in cell wall biosynthesis